MRLRALAVAASLAACGTGSGGASPSAIDEAPPATDHASPPGEPDAPVATPEDPAPAPAPVAPRLRVKFLGVGGFAIEYGGEAVLTAPLYTRPSMLEVTAGLVDAEPAAVDMHLPASALAGVRAVLSGHAHYDHLLDVPVVLDRAPAATLFANRSARNLLAAYAPDRAAKCAGTPAPAMPIARSRVVALDDPAASKVDYRLCPDKKPAGAPLEGQWVSVPGSHVRVLALCSEHPAQVGTVHYGEGDVEEEACTPPRRMDQWKEGATLAFLVDFLDPKTSEPLYRVYYQDAPTDAPTGHVPAAVLAGKRIDVALLCVGSSNHTTDAPAPTIAALVPRFAIGGHWEDFFRGAGESPQPIAFLDVPEWAKRARAAVAAGPAEPKAIVRNGNATTTRALVADPNDVFEVPR